jgi:hypothetical protein
MKPCFTSIDMKHYLKFFDLRMTNEGHVKMKPTKLNRTVIVRGAYGEEHVLRHTYEMNYADLQ